MCSVIAVTRMNLRRNLTTNLLDALRCAASRLSVVCDRSLAAARRQAASRRRRPAVARRRRRARPDGSADSLQSAALRPRCLLLFGTGAESRASRRVLDVGVDGGFGRVAGIGAAVFLDLGTLAVRRPF